MSTGDDANYSETTEYRTTEVRLRRPLPESKLASPDADPHVLKVRQPTGRMSGSSTQECSIEGGEIVIEYSGRSQTNSTESSQRPVTNTSIADYPLNTVQIELSDTNYSSEDRPVQHTEEQNICVQQIQVRSDEENRQSDVMLLQTPEQLNTYQRLLIVKDRGVVAVDEPNDVFTDTKETSTSKEQRPSSEAQSATSGGAMSYSVVSVTDDDTSEYKELNNTTLRRYYGDATPYGTVARVQTTSTSEQQPYDASISGTLGYPARNGYDTMPRSVTPMRATSPMGTMNSSYSTMLRRENGGFYTRMAETGPVVGNIGYVDFLPRKVKTKQSFNMSRNFERFENCMAEANKFLEQNPHVTIKSCESLFQKLDHSHRINPESTTSHDRSYVIGLRLWYTIEEGEEIITAFEPSSPVETTVTQDQNETTGEVSSTQNNSESKPRRAKLCYKNVIPECKEKTGPKDKPRKHRDCPPFENMKFTVEKMNESFVKNPIPGKLVNVETLPINYSHAFLPNGEIDPDLGYWCLDFQGHWNVFIVRIFYVEGQTYNNYEIDFEDFSPAPTKITPSCPEFQGFQALSVNASRWFSRESNNHVTVVGCQTVELPFRLKTLVANKGKIDTYRSCYEPSKISAYWNTLRILRVWYIRPREMITATSSRAGSSKIQPQTNGTIGRRGLGGGPGIAVRTFTPCQVTTPGCCGLRKPMFATTNDTVNRINEWIALTGADVIAIHTDNVEKWRGKKCEVGRPLEDRTYNKQDFPTSVAASSLEYRLTLFRVFVRCDSRGGFPEPEGKDFPACPPPVEPCCCFVGCSIM